MSKFAIFEKVLTDEIEQEIEEFVQPIKFWEKKQREIITSVVDYNLDTLASLIEKGNIDLKPKYQRRHRWDNGRKSRLVESFFMNVPVPPIFLNEDSYGKYSVIDGKQRLTAIYEFLRNRLVLSDLEVFSEINGKAYNDIDIELQSVISMRPTLRAVIILRQSDADIKYEVFQRLNSGGVKLNAQEIRNSAFTGSLNDLILELSENQLFHKLLGVVRKSSSPLYNEMKDAELVLRYFTFKDSWRGFKGGIRRHLDNFMDHNRHMNEKTVEKFKVDFIDAISKVYSAFGELAFKRWNPKTKKWRQPILSALFDTQMIACQEFALEDLRVNKDDILLGFQKLFNDEDFQKSIDAAIPSYFISRIERVTHMIRDIIESKKYETGN